MTGVQTCALPISATTMLLQALGEGIKKIDRVSNGQLLSLRPDIPWKDINGMRDHISHGYFELDADVIFDAAQNGTGPLREALEWIITQID